MNYRIYLLIFSLLFILGTVHGRATTGETKIISGYVYDREGEPIIGASIADEENPDLSTLSDMDGHFTLTDVPDSCVLKVSYIGFDTERVQTVPSETFYIVTLAGESSELNEVVVVGYGTQKKTDLTGAVSSIGRKNFTDRPVTNVTNALAGLAPGLTVTNSGGNTPGFESQSIRVRGQGTLNDAAPLVVVDGLTSYHTLAISPRCAS